MLLCIHLLVLRSSCQALCSHFFHEKLAIQPSKVLDPLTWTQCVADQRRCNIWQIWHQRLKLLPSLSLAYGTCTLKHSQVTSKQSMFEFAPILIILISSWSHPDIILISSWYPIWPAGGLGQLDRCWWLAHCDSKPSCLWRSGTPQPRWSGSPAGSFHVPRDSPRSSPPPGKISKNVCNLHLSKYNYTYITYIIIYIYMYNIVV